MEFSIKQSNPDSVKSGCVVVGVFEGGKLSAAAQVIDKAAKHALSDLIARGDMSGKSATTLLLHKLPGIVAERVLLVGLGKPAELNNKVSLEILGATFKALNGTPAKDAALYIVDEGVGKDAAWVVKQAVFTAAEQEYCGGRRDPVPHYAARFAAKEAFLKALGTGWAGGIRWQDVEILREPGATPIVRVHGLAATIA